MIPLTPAEIKDMWKQNGQEAAARGTFAHLQIECLLNGGIIAAAGEHPEVLLFLEFLRATKKMLAFRTEWCIWANDERLAGVCFVRRASHDV